MHELALCDAMLKMVRDISREQALEERCCRLEAEVAYLKQLRALVERDGL